MSLVHLFSIVVLSWSLAAAQALTCDPGRRYSHPLNCSAFIMCDENSNPNTFECPAGLHFNSEKSYCDWPSSAKCDPEYMLEEVDATGGNSSVNGTGEGALNFFNAVISVIENMKDNNGTWNDSVADKDTTAEMDNPKDEILEEEPEHEEFEEGVHEATSEEKVNGDHIETESIDEVLQEEMEKQEGDVNEENSGSENFTVSENERDVDISEGRLENIYSDDNSRASTDNYNITEEKNSEPSKRQIGMVNNQDFVNEEEEDPNPIENKTRDEQSLSKEEQTHESHQISNLTLVEVINSIGGEANSTTTTDDEQKMGENATQLLSTSPLKQEDTLVGEIAESNERAKYFFVNLNFTKDILGYEIPSIDVVQTNISEHADENERVSRNADHCKFEKCG